MHLPRQLAAISAAAVGGLLGLAAAAAVADLAPLAGPGVQPPAPWQWTGLPRQQVPLTRFDVVELDADRVLRVRAERSYGNLVHPLAGGNTAAALGWRWRVDRPIRGGDLLRKDGDDVALRVCAMFDMPLSQVPLFERTLFRIAASRSSEKLPTATLCYVWDATLPPGTLVVNPHTQRVRSIVVRGVGAALAQWTSERRDLGADFLRAFGDESTRVPALTAIAVAADSDNTDSHSVAYVDALRLGAP